LGVAERDEDVIDRAGGGVVLLVGQQLVGTDPRRALADVLADSFR